jgi:hypothetical protein
MAKAVVGQSVRITSTIGIDLAGASSVALWYKTPSGTKASVSATVTTPVTGVLYADISAATLAIVGNWFLMIQATLSNGNVVKSYGQLLTVVDEYALEA